MSLVAYGGTDDEISDSDTEQTVAAPVNNGTSAGGNNNVASTSSATEGVLSRLPEPSKDTPNSSLGTQEDDLEDIVKRRFKPDIPKPPPKKAGGKIQIAAPSLVQTDSDSEDESSKNRELKKPDPAKSTFLSSLPAPKHLSTKNAGRMFVPAALKRKAPAASKPAAKKPTTAAVSKASSESSHSASLLLGVASSSEDEEEDEPTPGSSFFSLGEEVRVLPAEVAPPLPPLKTKQAGSAIHPGPQLPAWKQSAVNPLAGPWRGHGSTQDAPLDFRPGFEPSPHPPPDQAYGGAGGAEEVEVGGEAEPWPPVAQGQPEVSRLGISEAELLRLQGRRRKKEEINLFDVHADDGTDKSLYVKNMTQETTYQSHRKKDDNLPSSQQKRKHQIQYLAFQAKERELELKNQWAANRQTKQQTQAKYGF